MRLGSGDGGVAVAPGEWRGRRRDTAGCAARAVQASRTDAAAVGLPVQAGWCCCYGACKSTTSRHKKVLPRAKPESVHLRRRAASMTWGGRLVLCNTIKL